jgi:hypothetical protein
MVKRNYKKPLHETRAVDNWKCPWCREIITIEPEAMQYSNFDIQSLNTIYLLYCFFWQYIYYSKLILTNL